MNYFRNWEGQGRGHLSFVWFFGKPLWVNKFAILLSCFEFCAVETRLADCRYRQLMIVGDYRKILVDIRHS